jgi:hypothetical protein
LPPPPLLLLPLLLPPLPLLLSHSADFPTWTWLRQPSTVE